MHISLTVTGEPRKQKRTPVADRQKTVDKDSSRDYKTNTFPQTGKCRSIN